MAVWIFLGLPCLILSLLICYGPESDIRVKSYDLLNLPRAFLFKFERLDIWRALIICTSEKLWLFEFCLCFLFQFLASLCIMGLNRKSEWKVMTVWISWELPLLNIERLDISWALIIHPSQKFWLFEFAESFLFQSQAPRYIIFLNRTSESKNMAVWICLALPCITSSVSIYYSPESDNRVKSYDHFARASVVQFCASRYVKGLNHTPESKFKAIWIFLLLPCTISKISMHYGPESDIRDKGYDRLNFWRASIDQFRASRYIMHLNQTSEWKVMTIWISRDLPLFNCECLDISWVSTIHPSQHIWLFEFAQSFGVQFWASRYVIR